ncbi:MAG: ABC transporter ATP-binding protein [Burkholderiales bacterium]|jgi:oligopeptide/dipeptide ABC transporter ATP-binding protein|nr:ABC transporter ATP-binding protein [Burkholderiales bacterium]
MNAAPLIEVRDLSRHFALRGGRWGAPPLQVRAVDHINFSIAAGETLSLVGESGCGKTTTGRLVLGIERPSGGTVSFDGKPVDSRQDAAWRARRRDLQMVFQDPLGALDPRMSVGRQIAEPLLIHGIGSAQSQQAATAEMLDAVGLPRAMAARYPHELSGGQQQRVVVARALMLKPRLVVCDEPVSALDVSVQAQVINLLARLQAERGLAYLFISHDLKVVRHISQRVAVMYLGQIVEIAGRDALFDRPQHPYTQALIAAVPVPDTTHRRPRTQLKGDPPSPVAPPPGCRFHTRCPRASTQCAEIAPPLRELEHGHQAACHHPGA